MSIGGSHYRMIVGDDFIRFPWVEFIKKESDVRKTLEAFLRQVHYRGEVEAVRIDEGGGFIGDAFQELSRRHRIKAEARHGKQSPIQCCHRDNC